MHALRALLRTLWQALLFTAGIALTLACCLGSMLLVALAGVLFIRGRDLTLGPGRLALWPESLPPVDFHAWAAPLYFLAGVAALIVVLPLGLTLMELLFPGLNGVEAEEEA